MMNSIYTTGHIIQSFTSTTNSYGGFTQVWGTTFSVSGYLRELRGDERLTADRKEVDSTHRVYCDTVTITEKNRFVDSINNIYDIRFAVQKDTGGIAFTQLDLRYTGEVAT